MNNTGSILRKEKPSEQAGFTLLDLLVVIGVFVILIIVQFPALAGSKSQSRIAVCMSHVRQIAQACQIYSTDNNDKLPVMVGSAVWAWDLPDPVAKAMLASSLTKKDFYCPGTEPRFTDKQNWANQNPAIGASSSLWGFGMTSLTGNPTDFHIIGYALAFSGAASGLAATNQNTSTLPESITMAGVNMVVPAAQRVLVADAIISASASGLPGYLYPQNNYVSIFGGFQQNGMAYPHLSPHLKGNVPTGGNLGFKDGHVEWRKFEFMTPRTTSGPVFWW